MILRYRVMLWCFFILIWGCDKEDMMTAEDEDVVEEGVVPADEVLQFVWNGMNQHYYWQDRNDLLLDEVKANNLGEWYEFLNAYDSPVDLFGDLLYMQGEVDRFSWIEEDYEILEQRFSGISTSPGFDFQLFYATSIDSTWGGSSKDIVGVVNYLSNASENPAAGSGIARGDVFARVNGEQLNEDNFRRLLQEPNSLSLEIVALDSLSNKILRDSVIKRADVTKAVIQDDPVLLSKTIDLQGRQVGYLHYTAFQNNSHDELVDAFRSFRGDGVEDLVLDLRYNPGGSVYSCLILSSLIYDDDINKRHSSIEYNSKNRDNDVRYNFQNGVLFFDDKREVIGQERLVSLNLPRLYILTGRNTASASELLVNALRPYMDVTLIGRRTVGKNEVSRTLYDNPSEDYGSDTAGRNPNHKWVMQPIIGIIYNSQGQSDYVQGFEPEIEVNEYAHLSSMKPLGDPQELLLHAALNDICSGCLDNEISRSSGRGGLLRDMFDGPSTLKPNPFGMYITELPD